jgi:hypothetical protein
MSRGYGQIIWVWQRRSKFTFVRPTLGVPFRAAVGSALTVSGSASQFVGHTESIG